MYLHIYIYLCKHVFNYLFKHIDCKQPLDTADFRCPSLDLAEDPAVAELVWRLRADMSRAEADGAAMGATVKSVDSRAILRVDRGVLHGEYIEAPTTFLMCRMHILLANK